MSYANSIVALKAKFLVLMGSNYTIYTGYGMTSEEFADAYPSDDKAVFISHDGHSPFITYEDLTQEGVKESISIFIKIPFLSGTTENYNLNEINRVMLELMKAPTYEDTVLGDRIYNIDSIIPVKSDIQIIHLINLTII